MSLIVLAKPGSGAAVGAGAGAAAVVALAEGSALDTAGEVPGGTVVSLGSVKVGTVGSATVVAVVGELVGRLRAGSEVESAPPAEAGLVVMTAEGAGVEQPPTAAARTTDVIAEQNLSYPRTPLAWHRHVGPRRVGSRIGAHPMVSAVRHHTDRRGATVHVASNCARWPARRITSIGFTLVARTLIRTEPSLAWGSGASSTTRTSGAPYEWKRAARM